MISDQYAGLKSSAWQPSLLAECIVIAKRWKTGKIAVNSTVFTLLLFPMMRLTSAACCSRPTPAPSGAALCGRGGRPRVAGCRDATSRRWRRTGQAPGCQTSSCGPCLQYIRCLLVVPSLNLDCREPETPTFGVSKLSKYVVQCIPRAI